MSKVQRNKKKDKVEDTSCQVSSNQMSKSLHVIKTFWQRKVIKIKNMKTSLIFSSSKWHWHNCVIAFSEPINECQTCSKPRPMKEEEDK
jgi:hypothetical protein